MADSFTCTSLWNQWMLSHPLKLVWLSGNLRSRALSEQTDLLPSGLMQVVRSLNTRTLQGLVLSSFSHAGNTILIVMLSVGEIFPSALARGHITQSGTWLFFVYTGHTNISLQTLPHASPYSLSFSPSIYLSVFTHELKIESTPEVCWHSSI